MQCVQEDAGVRVDAETNHLGFDVLPLFIIILFSVKVGLNVGIFIAVKFISVQRIIIKATIVLQQALIIIKQIVTALLIINKVNEMNYSQISKHKNDLIAQQNSLYYKSKYLLILTDQQNFKMQEALISFLIILCYGLIHRRKFC